MEKEAVLSKKDLKKLQKKADQKNRKANEVSNNKPAEDEEDVSAGQYGMISAFPDTVADTTAIVHVRAVDTARINEHILISGNLHQVRKTGKQAFLVVRQELGSVQCIACTGATVSRQMLNFIGSIPRESVVNVYGTVLPVDKPVESCTQSNVEIHVAKIFVVSKGPLRLAMQIEDAMRPDTEENEGLAKVNLDTRLDNRYLELRTPTNQAIFRIAHSVLSAFRSYFDNLDFVEIMAPKIVSSASEGGADVFTIKYFAEQAYLAQSPQFYKQMSIVGGLERVYTTGPVFRAENSNTHRHLTEFTGLDIEMVIHRHYHEVLHTICGALVAIFQRLQSQRALEIEIVGKQFPAEPFEFLEPTLVLTYAEGIDMLRTAGVEMSDDDDLSTTNEKLLGVLVKKKFGTDFFVLDRFPTALRPFYTMPAPEEPSVSHAYDLFMRGEEIMSGSQRIHDAAVLRQSAKARGIKEDSIKDYLDSFENACKPHAGGGIGLERVVMLFLGLDNIRRCSLFPRDPKRIRP